MTTLNELHGLALSLAPEFGEGGLCILRHQPTWPDHGEAQAYAIRGRLLHIREHLREIGEWSGAWPGSIIVFAAEPTVAILLHEMSHLLPAMPPIPDDGALTAEDAKSQWQHFLTGINRAANPPQQMPWEDHDLGFIRTALHLHWRAERLGVSANMHEMFITSHYGLSGEWAYAHALGSEPQRFARKTFAEIDAEPFIEPFAKLFAKDVRRFRESLPEELNK